MSAPTVLEILRKSQTFLADKGVEEAKLDSEHLLASVLSCSRMELYLEFERPVSEEELAKLRTLVVRRGKREPLAYILGWAPFHELRLTVAPGVLIPRPETEELVEQVADRLDSTPRSALDLGTGSGAIALWLKSSYPDCRVVAIDRSPEALAIARKNGTDLGLAVEWREGDWTAGLTDSFELIVSNPPYLTEKEWETAAVEVRNNEPKMALIGGKTGMDSLAAVLEQSYPLLTPGGLIALETGIQQEALLRSHAARIGYSECEVCEDFSGRPRFFFGLK